MDHRMVVVVAVAVAVVAAPATAVAVAVQWQYHPCLKTHIDEGIHSRDFRMLVFRDS